VLRKPVPRFYLPLELAARFSAQAVRPSRASSASNKNCGQGAAFRQLLLSAAHPPLTMLPPIILNGKL